MERIVEVHPLPDYNLEIRFDDGFLTQIDIKPFIRSGISEQLLDSEFFNDVRIDEFYGIFWQNGFDFCPNFLRQYTTHAPIEV